MSGTKGDPQQGEESPDVRTFVPSSAAGEPPPLLEQFVRGVDQRAAQSCGSPVAVPCGDHPCRRPRWNQL